MTNLPRSRTQTADEVIRLEIATIDELMDIDPDVEKEMAFFAKVYQDNKPEDSPGWEEIKPRVEAYMVYLYNKNLRRKAFW